jgi:hypothetical protein
MVTAAAAGSAAGVVFTTHEVGAAFIWQPSLLHCLGNQDVTGGSGAERHGVGIPIKNSRVDKRRSKAHRNQPAIQTPGD